MAAAAEAFETQAVLGAEDNANKVGSGTIVNGASDVATEGNKFQQAVAAWRST